MGRGRSELSRRLLLALSSVTITSAFLMHLSNRYVNRYPPELLAFNVEALILIFGCWILVLGIYLRIRLKSYHAAVRSGFRRASDQTESWERLTRLPPELFRLAIVLGLMATVGYEWAERTYMKTIGFAVADDGSWLWLIKGVVLNLTTTFLFAAIYYGLARMIVRPYILHLQKIDVSRVTFRSFSGPLIFTFVIVMTMVIIRILWYAANSRIQQHPIEWQVMFAISLIGLAGGLLLFWLIALGFRRQAQTMEAGIEELIREGKAGIPRKVALTSSDETGELAAALNDLQTRLSRDYAELKEELQLARKVRDKLLPQPQARCGKLDIAFRALTEDDPGGEFYDIAAIDQRRMAVIAGRVPEQGAAAVLMISAFLALFRAEAGKDEGAAASSILHRLMMAWSENFPDLGRLSAGLAVVDRCHSTVAAALAGGAAVLRAAADGSGDMPVLKTADETSEKDTVWQLRPGESLCIGPVREISAWDDADCGRRAAWVQITRK